MLSTKRRLRIVSHLNGEGLAGMTELCRITDSSVSTVRRDLLALQDEGIVRRIRGGAVLAERHHEVHEQVPALRIIERINEKRRISAAAGAMLSPGTTVLVTGGSTTQLLVPYLREVPRITVVTNSILVAHELGLTSNVPVIVLGGYLRSKELSLLGMRAVEAMADLQIDVVFCGAYGLDPEVGVLGADVAEADTDRALLDRVDRLVVLADSSKFFRRSPVRLVPPERISCLVTDSEAPDSAVDGFRNHGVQVTCC